MKFFKKLQDKFKVLGKRLSKSVSAHNWNFLKNPGGIPRDISIQLLYPEKIFINRNGMVFVSEKIA